MPRRQEESSRKEDNTDLKANDERIKMTPVRPHYDFSGHAEPAAISADSHASASIRPQPVLGKKVLVFDMKWAAWQSTLRDQTKEYPSKESLHAAEALHYSEQKSERPPAVAHADLRDVNHKESKPAPVMPQESPSVPTPAISKIGSLRMASPASKTQKAKRKYGRSNRERVSKYLQKDMSKDNTRAINSHVLKTDLSEQADDSSDDKSLPKRLIYDALPAQTQLEDEAVVEPTPKRPKSHAISSHFAHERKGTISTRSNVPEVQSVMSAGVRTKENIVTAERKCVKSQGKRKQPSCRSLPSEQALISAQDASGHQGQADATPRTENGQISGAPTHVAQGRDWESPLDQRFLKFVQTHKKLAHIKKVGSGGFAKVYEATDTATGKKVAVKRFTACQGYSPCMSEAKILQRLHEHRVVEGIVSLCSIETAPRGGLEAGDEPCLVLNYFEHDDPSTYVRNLSREELRLYARALFGALEHVHGLGFVHRDVKPGNFLYNRAARRHMLTDFGLAHSCCDSEGWTPHRSTQRPGEKPKRVNRGGTKGFRAPEILLASPCQTTAIDIWSAGIVLLFLICRNMKIFSLPCGDTDLLQAILSMRCIVQHPCGQDYSEEEHGHLRQLDKLLDYVRSAKFTLSHKVSEDLACWRVAVELTEDCPKRPWRGVCDNFQRLGDAQGKYRLLEAPGGDADCMFDLLDRCLDMDPRTRITASQALQHPFLTSDSS